MYYPDDKDFAISNGKLTDTLSCASEFEFNMPAQNQMYDALEERISMVQILRAGTEIFYGEVREIKESLDKIKSIYCVGELAFLFDSTQPQARYQNVEPVQMFTEMLNIHNSKVEEKKRFEVGIVTVTDPNNSIYRYTNGEDTLTAIRKKLCEPLGGYLRIRKENGKRYLDLVPLEEYGVSAEQPIQFGRNLLKYNSKRSGANIATVCVPRGAKLDTQVVEGLDAYVDIKSVNDGKDYVINQAAFETYGWIEKIVEWKDVTQPENLLKKAQEWVSNNQYRVLSLKLKAVDLAELNVNLSPYKVGDMIHAIAEPFGMDMWFPLMKKVTYINDSITNDVTLSYEAKVNYTSQQNNSLQDIGDAIPQETDLLVRARENAAAMLNLASQGNIYYVYDEEGRPVEQLIMDTNDINTAQKVWRWNINGLAYSSNGYKGPYELAMTMDGAIVCNFLKVGEFSADRVRGGVFTASEFNVQGQVVKTAADFTEDDLDIVNRKILGIEETTLEDLEKYDIDGDGNITTLDLLKINRLLLGTEQQYVIDTSLKISPLSSQNIIKTAGVSIGTLGIKADSTKANETYNDKYYTKLDEKTGYRSGQSGAFYAMGSRIEVRNGLVMSLPFDGDTTYWDHGNGWKTKQLGVDNVYEILYFGDVNRGVMSEYGAWYYAPFDLSCPYEIAEVYEYNANVYNSTGLMGVQMKSWSSTEFSFYLYSALPEDYGEKLSFRAIVKAI